MSVEVVKIRRQASGQVVDAKLHDDLGLLQLTEAESKWKFERYGAVMHLLAAGAQRDQMPEHWHWDWVAKAPKAGTVGVRVFGIECDGDWQGLAMTTTVGYVARLSPDAGQGLVYVKYVESAPWNSKSMTNRPRFSAVGTRLIEAAVRQSVDAGFGGRVGLHSLPTAQLFYERIRFKSTGLDAAVENLPYYELTSLAAQSYLKGGTP
jgi:hypothetical protein